MTEIYWGSGILPIRLCKVRPASDVAKIFGSLLDSVGFEQGRESRRRTVRGRCGKNRCKEIKQPQRP